MAKTSTRKRSKATSPTPASITDELTAAFAWARMTIAERERFRARYPLDAQSIVRNTTASDFDFTAFEQQQGKKNFSENLSRHLASRFAGELSEWFEGILPDPEGKGHESKARTAKGYKKLDVNYSTPQLGLGLGVSIKTINAKDSGSGRYTKNFTRVDAELRAEAADYHERQPYAVMVAVILLPSAACDDGARSNPSSFGAAVKQFRYRSGRERPSDSYMLFERVYVGYYDTSPNSFGIVHFLDVMTPPPRVGRPRNSLSLQDVIAGIVDTYDRRNNPDFVWDDGVEEEGMTGISSADDESGEDDSE